MIHGSSIVGDLHGIRHVGGIVQFDRLAVEFILMLVDDRRRGGDQVEIELALEPLLDDLEVQQPQKAAAEAEAERGRAFHLVGKARIVEAQPAHRGAQILEIRRRRPETARRTRPAAPA